MPAQPQTFSVGETRHLIDDLFVARPAVYWLDFLLSLAVAALASYQAHESSPLSPRQLLFFAVSCAAFYRAAVFTHELTHLRRGSMGAFRVAWNVLCGVPLLMPSFLYYPHLEHHARAVYGTVHDGEYIPWATQPPRTILSFLVLSLGVPFVAVFRFLVCAPLAWVSPRFRRLIEERASSLVINFNYLRPAPARRERILWRLQEASCFAYLVALGALISTGRLSPSWAVQFGCTLAAVALLNSVRVLVAHRYRSGGREVSFLEQLLDSVNYPRRPLLTEVWAPVGLRFHALHHIFPSLPYHSLPEAHRRLMAALPADSPYRLTESPGLFASLRLLWRESRVSCGAGASALACQQAGRPHE